MGCTVHMLLHSKLLNLLDSKRHILCSSWQCDFNTRIKHVWKHKCQFMQRVTVHFKVCIKHVWRHKKTNSSIMHWLTVYFQNVYDVCKHTPKVIVWVNFRLQYVMKSMHMKATVRIATADSRVCIHVWDVFENTSSGEKGRFSIIGNYRKAIIGPTDINILLCVCNSIRIY